MLALAAEGPSHGFAIARAMVSGGEIGRIYTVAKPAVYRAIERLLDAGLLKALGDEPGDRGPRRTPLAITAGGRRRLDTWLFQPVEHIRDLRTVFLVKLMLIDRAGLDPGDLLSAQIAAVRPIISSIEDRSRASAGRERAMQLWRAHSARAALAFLVALADERRLDAAP